jgi:hypothetical protein
MQRPGIWQRMNSPKGGMPDVVAWSHERPRDSAIFVECKGPKEAIGAAQEDWVRAAKQVGIDARQIAVSIRPF